MKTKRLIRPMNKPCSPRELVSYSLVRPVNKKSMTCSPRELVRPIFGTFLVRPVNTLKELPGGYGSGALLWAPAPAPDSTLQGLQHHGGHSANDRRRLGEPRGTAEAPSKPLADPAEAFGDAFPPPRVLHASATRDCNRSGDPMTNHVLKVALTKRALATQLKRAGCPKQEAESVTERLSQAERWRKLPVHVQAEIAWKALIAPRRNA